MVNDPISDMLAQIKNASAIGRQSVELPYSKLKKALADILVREGYLANATCQGEAPRLKLGLTLKYDGKSPAITDVKRISKPGRRHYVPKTGIHRVINGLGISVLSTSSGMMTDREARKKGIGGEVLCEIW